MSNATPLDYAGRCERYARQRGWAYDPHELSIGHLTPRQRRRALRKERHATPCHPADIGPYNDGYDGAFYDAAGYTRDDPHDLGYCVTPGCDCCDDPADVVERHFLGDLDNWTPAGVQSGSPGWGDERERDHDDAGPF